MRTNHKYPYLNPRYEMDPLEDLFRARPNNKLCLQQYIQLLLDSDHVLEADFFWKRLQRIDPDSIETNRLGFMLSLQFANTDVSEFDRKMRLAGAEQELLYSLHLQYYYTYSDHTNMKKCAISLLDIEPTDDYTIRVLVDAIIDLNDYELTRKFISNLIPRFQMSKKLEKRIRRQVIHQLIKLIKCASNNDFILYRQTSR